MGTRTYPRILLSADLPSIPYLLNPEKAVQRPRSRASLPGVSKVVASIAVYIILFATVGFPSDVPLPAPLFIDALPDIRRMIPSPCSARG
ncbi:hypothetical protein [Bilophila wadsworthia]|uniref:hypothetical protein n=1 Tax=Bilophila wadsworthia TaxID=35833 RepID=UPI003990D6F8